MEGQDWHVRRASAGGGRDLKEDLSCICRQISGQKSSQVLSPCFFIPFFLSKVFAMNDKADLARIFAEAQEIESLSERTAFLDKHCAGNANLRAEVERLLNLAPAVGSDFLGGRGMAEPMAEAA